MIRHSDDGTTPLEVAILNPSNTDWDLVANLVGAIAAAVWLWFRGRARAPLGPSHP